LRDGSPDWLLLRRGDVWHESLGAWKLSGRSPSEPLLVATYGDAPARPLLATGTEGGVWTDGGGGSPATIDHLALVGLHFRADGFDGRGDCVGARMLQPGSHFLIEDCKFEAYSTNLVFQGLGGRHRDFRLRRSVIVDAYSIHGSGAHPQGLYAYAVDGLLIEECLFDHNGWNAHVANAGADVYSHDLYIDNGNSGVVVRGNIIANAASHGMQLRSGGTVLDNLFVRNSIALSVGGGNDPELDGVRAELRGNVILDGKDIDSESPRGWGIWLANIASGRVHCNVIADHALGQQPIALVLDGNHAGDKHASIGVHKLSIEHNVCYGWRGGVVIEGDSHQLTGIELLRNDFQERGSCERLLEHVDPDGLVGVRSAHNRFYSASAATPTWIRVGADSSSFADWKLRVRDSTSLEAPADYPDPHRNVASYERSIGSAETTEGFLQRGRARARAEWDARTTAAAVNRHVRAGFGLECE
jgi:hypothetical protein